MRHTSIRTIKQPKTLPYPTPFTCSLIQKKKSKAWKKYCKDRNSCNFKRYQEYRNLVTNEIKKLKQNYENKLAQQIKVNPKLFWRHVSTEKPERQSVPILWENRRVISTPERKAEVFNKQFSSVILGGQDVPNPYIIFLPYHCCYAW